MDIKKANDIAKEANENLDMWLKASEISKNDLLLLRCVDSFKIEEQEFGDIKQIFIKVKQCGQIFYIGAPLQQGPVSEEEFYYDAFLLCISIAKFIDEENNKNPINGSYANNYFRRSVERFFEPKLKKYKIETEDVFKYLNPDLDLKM